MTFTYVLVAGAAMQPAPGGIGALRQVRGNHCSFSGDTPVLMADGSTKPISEVEIGDQVLAADPETGEVSAQSVVAVWVHEDTLIDLVIQPEGQLATVADMSASVGRATVTTTADHPFWNYTDQQWQPAIALDPGDKLLAADSTRPTAVGLLPYTQHRGDAYNLTITGPHTYHVLAGTTPVLVHNVGCGISWGPAQLQNKFKHAQDFGVPGNYSRENAKAYQQALEKHVHDPNIITIRGTYRGDLVVHHYNPVTGRNVIVDPRGNFVSGWKLGSEQARNLLDHGGLR